MDKLVRATLTNELNKQTIPSNAHKWPDKWAEQTNYSVKRSQMTWQMSWANTLLRRTLTSDLIKHITRWKKRFLINQQLNRTQNKNAKITTEFDNDKCHLGGLLEVLLVHNRDHPWQIISAAQNFEIARQTLQILAFLVSLGLTTACGCSRAASAPNRVRRLRVDNAGPRFLLAESIQHCPKIWVCSERLCPTTVEA